METKVMRQYTVTMSDAHEGYDLHARGCRHTRSIGGHRIFGHARSTSAEALKAGLLDRFADNGWTPEMIRIMGCSDKAPVSE